MAISGRKFVHPINSKTTRLMNRRNVPKSSLPSSVLHTGDWQFDEQIYILVAAADSPVVMVGESPERDLSTEFKDTVFLSLEPETDLISSLEGAVASLVPGFDSMGSTDPEDWSVAIRKATRENSQPSEFHLLVVDNFSATLQGAKYEGELFAALVSHISCLDGFSVALITGKSDAASLAALPGFEHMTGIETNSIVEVPQYWIPPEAPDNVDPPTNFCTRCVKSNLILGSSIATAMAMVLVSIWVTDRLGVNLAIRSATSGQLQDAEITSISVASPDTPEKMPVEEEEFVFDPIPVAMVPLVSGEDFSGDDSMPGIPDFAQNLTEEIYLKNLLTVDEFPYESIALTGRRKPSPPPVPVKIAPRKQKTPDVKPKEQRPLPPGNKVPEVKKKPPAEIKKVSASEAVTAADQ